MFAIGLHIESGGGDQISGVSTAPVLLLNPAPLEPPVTRTVPSGSMVSVCWRRAKFIGRVVSQVGDPALRSMISQDVVGGSAPPATRIRPSAHCTALPYERFTLSTWLRAVVDQAPVPVTLRK